MKAWTSWSLISQPNAERDAGSQHTVLLDASEKVAPLTRPHRASFISSRTTSRAPRSRLSGDGCGQVNGVRLVRREAAPFRRSAGLKTEQPPALTKRTKKSSLRRTNRTPAANWVINSPGPWPPSVSMNQFFATPEPSAARNCWGYLSTSSMSDHMLRYPVSGVVDSTNPKMFAWEGRS